MSNSFKSAPVGWLRPKGICYVSDKYKLIFVTIPKNASTSIRNMPEFEFHKGNIMSYEKELKDGEYRAFTIIRDPIKRFSSGYIELCARATGDSPHILSKDFYWEKGKKRFSKFLDELEKDWFDIHLFPQSYFLTNYQGDPFLIDAYIDIEYLSEAFPVVLNKYGISLPAVPRLNVQSDNRQSGISKKRKSKIDLTHPRRSLYYLMDYMVRRLQRKRIPTSVEVNNYIFNDKQLLHRVNDLLESDIKYLGKLEKEFKSEPVGIYWRRS